MSRNRYAGSGAGAILALLGLAACATRQAEESVAYTLRGAGAPVVVFEAGLGGGKAAWAPVFDKVAAFTTAVSYDRRGNGKSSDPASVLATPEEKAAGGTRTGAVIVAELHETLMKAGVRPPYVLVGHSLGGLYASLYARTYPGEVAGLVLVDSMHPEQIERCQHYLPARKCDPEHYPWWAKLLIKLTPPMIQAEMAGAAETGRQIRAAGPLPPLPLVVISHGKPPENKNSRERMWADLQQDLAAESPRSSRIIAHKSGHNIHHDEPEVVVRAINDLVLQIRQAEAASR